MNNKTCTVEENDSPKALAYPIASASALASRNTAKSPPRSWQKVRAASQVFLTSLAMYRHVPPNFRKVPEQEASTQGKNVHITE